MRGTSRGSLRQGLPLQVPGERLVVYMAGVNWHSVEGTDRRLVEHLKRRVPVLWVDPPESPLAPSHHRQGTSPGRVAVTAVDERLSRLTATGPPLVTRPVVRDVAGQMLSLAIRRVVTVSGARRVTLIATSPEGRFAALPRAQHVYYATDDFVEGAHLMGLSSRRLARRERRQVAEADLLVAVSEAVASRWATGGKRVLVLPNGCEPDRFASVDSALWPDDVRLTSPIAGVVGHISRRLNLRLLEAVADSGISLLLVGPVEPEFATQAFDRLVSRSNVQWVGRKDYSQLPSYLRVIDVGLTPYADTPFNRASFPLKTLEYLSAGRPVVSVPLPAVDWLGTELVLTSAAPADFASSVRRALARAETDPDLSRLCREFAALHSWSARADTLMDALKGARVR